jgi:hypothetical protein
MKPPSIASCPCRSRAGSSTGMIGFSRFEHEPRRGNADELGAAAL